MGAFFTSLQVRTDDTAGLVEAVCAQAAADGMDRVADGADADRTVVVVPADGAGWASVYDQRSESQDLSVLEVMGARVSRSWPAVSVMVHDSDHLDLRLFVEGRRAALDEVGLRRRSAGSWAPLLGDEGQEALRRELTGRDLFAEAALRRAAQVLGIPESRVHVGYRYLVEAPLAPSAVALRFRARQRPSWEAPASGPPRLEVQGAHQAMRFGVGDELRLGFSTRSVGGPGRGLRVVVWGAGLSMIELGPFEVLVGDPRTRRHVFVPPEARTDATGRPLQVAELAEVELPAGAADPHGTGGDPMAHLQRFIARQVHVNVVGRVVAAGAGPLSVGLVPMEHPDGAAACTVELTLEEPSRRPLRAAPDASSHLLRPLAGDALWLGLAMVDGDRAEVAHEVGVLLDALLEASPPEQMQTALFFADAQRKPRTGKGLGPRQRTTLVKAMATEGMVEIRTRRWSVAAGVGVLPMYMERRVMGVAVAAEVGIEGIDTRIDALFERLVERGALSAALSRAAPEMGFHPDMMPYDLACGLQGPFLMGRDWNRRWLRMPGDRTTWLGRELAARVDDRALPGVVRLCDGSVRIDLDHRGQIAELERALADILPTAADGWAASQAWHRG